MNERIKELAIQTDEYFKKQGGSFFRYQWNEKFAQLIVQECAELSKNYAGGSMPLSIALAIKEHFGVE